MISLNVFINIALQEKFNDAIFLSIFSLTKFCRLSIKKELEYSSTLSLVSLGNIGKKVSAENMEDLTKLTSNYIIKMGKLAIERELDDVILFTINSLVNMAQISPRKYNLINKAINYILEAGRYSTKNHIGFIEEYSTGHLKRISDKLLNNEDGIFLANISKYFFETAINYLENELIYQKEINEQVMLRLTYLKEIAINCTYSGYMGEAIRIQNYLTLIAQLIIKLKFNEIKEEPYTLKTESDELEIIISKYLIEICKSAIETKLIMNTSIKEIPIISTAKDGDIINIILEFEQFNPYSILETVIGSMLKIGKLYAQNRLNSSIKRIKDDSLEIDVYSEHFFKNDIEQHIKYIENF